MEGHNGRQVLGLQREALEVGGPREDDPPSRPPSGRRREDASTARSS